jgi:hypothetical protein
VVLHFDDDASGVRIGARRPARYSTIGGLKPEGAQAPDVEINLQDLEALAELLGVALERENDPRRSDP